MLAWRMVVSVLRDKFGVCWCGDVLMVLNVLNVLMC